MLVAAAPVNDAAIAAVNEVVEHGPNILFQRNFRHLLLIVAPFTAVISDFFEKSSSRSYKMDFQRNHS